MEERKYDHKEIHGKTEQSHSPDTSMENIKKKEIIKDRWQKGYIRTDGDVDDLCIELRISVQDIEFCIAQEKAKGTPCENCRHLINRYSYQRYHPCCRCSRINKVKDYYDPCTN